MNDFDPMDDIPAYLPREQFEHYLGMPLKNVPSPEPSALNFAEYFADDFKKAIAHAGFTPEYSWASDLYLSGRMDGAITGALKNAEKIRTIYKEVSGSQKEGEWLPLSVVCPGCGKIATTEASDFDGKTVAVLCREDKVEYTKGCGFAGRVSPFGGKAKLPWKVEWAAKWKVGGVLVEGAGKDHSTRGGSRDVANHISKEVFNYEPPFDIPYEFLLAGGKKMSSSKGRGSSAKEISDLVPTKIFRLALLGRDINQQINFDPEGDTIPVLYDQYDKLALSYWAGVKDDYARLFSYLFEPTAESAGERSSGLLARPQSPGGQGEARPFLRRIPPPVFLPRFSQVAFIVQMPHLKVEVEVEKIKGGALTAEDKTELKERASYAKKWLAQYAPERFVYELQKTLPDAANSLSDAQKKALGELLRYIEVSPQMPSGDDLHKKLHEIKEGQGIAPAELFKAIYLAFLGKTHGPQAGWFLSALERDFVLSRLVEILL
ncbi:lysine--tRNA ligase [Patescibacteria group bacterium]|nr:lysine--tRNA ligase [Patescibacteria group bacterium]